VPFLNEIDRRVRAISEPSSSSSSGVTIFAHAHLGLSSYISRLGGVDSETPSSSSSSSSSPSPYPSASSVALPAQVQAHLEFLDELLVAYGPATRVLLVGHSIGSWLIQEILKARATAALRPRVGAAYMLFPTISHIKRSPNGRKLSVRVRSLRSPPPLFLKTISANPVVAFRLYSLFFARLGHGH
jgi:pimeloyl-ACP methyl ester carboxylesterase